MGTLTVVVLVGNHLITTMMLLIALFASLLVLCTSHAVVDEAWEAYKLEYGKVYTAEEDVIKYATWQNNMAAINLHNSQFGNTYTQGMSQFTDMTDEEFKAGPWTGLRIPEEYLNGTEQAPGRFLPSNAPLPNAVDWRSQGLVTPIKNQGQCGSCYSFSATGALEGAWKRHTGNLISLSESQIVDCSGKYGNYGCQGGWYMAAWKYIRDVGGSACESKYPYVASKGWCRWNTGMRCATVSSYHDTAPGSEADLTAALAEVGPVSVAIDATRSGFRSYRTGVFYDPYCSSSALDHAVLAVGYGSEGGMDYYLVKNSWGTWWGDQGYIKMARNRNNHCGIASKPSYPIVKGGPAPTIHPDPCHDDNQYCPSWARAGECQRNPGYMLQHCKKSCHVC